MANVQILFLVRGVFDETALRTAVATAGRAAGFTAGPSTWASGSSRVERIAGETLHATFTDGPWAGLTLHNDTPFPAVPSLGPWSALRMNLLGGPEGATVAVGGAVREALGDSNVIRSASRTPRNAISWDRGVPAPLPLSESSSPGSTSSSGWLVALMGVAGLAWVARSAR